MCMPNLNIRTRAKREIIARIIYVSQQSQAVPDYWATQQMSETGFPM